MTASERQFRGELDLLHRDVGFYILNTLDPGQMIDLELPIVIEIAGHNAQQKVEIARHQVALDNLRQGADGIGEVVDGFDILPGQPDTGEDRHAHPDFRRVKYRDVALNDTSFL